MTIAAGTKLGRYEISTPLGAGGMGEVYLARDTKLDRKVALKILPAEGSSHRERMDRFIREAKAAAVKQTPKLLPLFTRRSATRMRHSGFWKEQLTNISSFLISKRIHHLRICIRIGDGTSCYAT